MARQFNFLEPVVYSTSLLHITEFLQKRNVNFLLLQNLNTILATIFLSVWFTSLLHITK